MKLYGNNICLKIIKANVFFREQKKRRGVSGYKEGLEHRTYHCQNLTAYPASAVNFCSDVEVQYPHLRMYVK